MLSDNSMGNGISPKLSVATLSDESYPNNTVMTFMVMKSCG